MKAKIGLLTGLIALALCAMAAPAAQAAPQWDTKLRWADTTLKPGESGEFAIRVQNYGDSPSEGAFTVTLELPPGVTRIPPAPLDSLFGLFEGPDFTCEGSSVVTCERSTPLPAWDIDIPLKNDVRIYIPVGVGPEASGTHPVKVTVSGGGAAESATDVDQVTIGGSEDEFGIVDGSYGADFYDDARLGGNPVRQAGAHPFELRVNFDFNMEADEIPSPAPGVISPQRWMRTIGYVRTTEATLPTGFVGNPEATPKCSPEDFLAEADQVATNHQYYLVGTKCPPETQVGVLDLELNNWDDVGVNHAYTNGFANHAGSHRIPVFNLEPPVGEVADFGFKAADFNGHIYPKLDPAQDYAIKALVPYISSIYPVRQAEFTMWGVPGDPAHDRLRADPNGDPTIYGEPSNAPIQPLLTLPMDCDSAGSIAFRAESWNHKGQWTPKLQAPVGGIEPQGCGDPRIKFHSDVDIQPSNRSAGGPTGLLVDMKVPQKPDTVTDATELYTQNGDIQALATPPVKKAVVTLPEGMTVSPSAAQGLGSCAPDQIKLGTDAPVSCPDSSQYGTLTLKTPILPRDEPMTGQIYIAKQNDNPFDNFLSLYLVIQEPERGLLVKVPGKVDLDPHTGQIKTTFDDLPQFPFSSMQMRLKGGVRAALVNPSTCGTKTIVATFYPWHDPGSPVTEESSYEVSGDCVGSLSDRPFDPELTVGTVNPIAGQDSPLAIRMTRTDSDQELSTVEGAAPAGLTASLRGIGRCTEAQIAAASASGRSGLAERFSPSCPQDSHVGSVDAGAGVGEVLTYVKGEVYLAGPYKGAPVSGVVITPAVAGPFDLGVIVTRAPAYVDPVTTQVTLKADPLPLIFKGIPVRVRDVRVNLDRPGFIRNPTDCQPKSVQGRVASSEGKAKQLSNRFQVADCAALGFAPRLALGLRGGMGRGANPALTAVVRPRPGDANIARAAVTLPRSAFLDQSHIRTICTRVQFAAKSCPKGAIYGRATAWTPLLDEPLRGPVYLRSSDNTLPDMVAHLKGPAHTPIEVELAGRIDSVKGGIRNTFELVPDAPVSRFVLRMQGGKKGLIQNSRPLCKTRNRATVRLIGQNARRHNPRPLVRPQSCKRKRTAKRSAHRSRAGVGLASGSAAGR